MIEVNNLTKEKIEPEFLEKTAELVLKGENRYNKELSVALVSAKEIEKLNNKFRGKDYPTDVLSFEGLEKNNELGEVIICPLEVKANAKEDKIEFKTELAKVLIHGILHLCGYDHEGSEEEAGRMRGKETEYLERNF